jgi:outer membrane protein
MHLKNIFSTLFLLVVAQQLFSQEKWDLQRAVEYALANNISVKRADVDARLAALNLRQSKLYQFPTANINGSTGLYGGRSIDPTTNLFTNQQILSSSFSLNSQMTVFNFFAVRNNIEGNRYDNAAAQANYEKVKNDIALNVATAYLQILVSFEQQRIAQVAVQQTLNNLENTRKRVEAGALPELNLAELEAQLATDSTGLISQQATVRTNILQLQAILNQDASQAFDVATPPLDQIPVEPLAELLPETVYQLALQNLPQQKVSNLRIEAAKRYAESARGQMYPSLGVFAGLGSQYSNNKQIRVGEPVFENEFSPTNSKVVIAGQDFPVMQQRFTVPTSVYKDKFGLQISDNFRQNIGLNLSIPLFNNGQARTAWERSKLNITTLTLQRDQELLTLKQNIYTAYNDATSALQRFNSGKKAVLTAEKALNFAQKRYDLGLLSTIDLLTNQNNLNRARVQLAQAQVDYVFRMKLLEFYKGQGLKLR